MKWIPLVGWLLGGVVAFAAAVFALVVGVVISCLVIALAWVFYRPLYGVLLLALMGIGVYFIFFFGPDSTDESTEGLTDGSSTEATTVAVAPAS